MAEDVATDFKVYLLIAAAFAVSVAIFLGWVRKALRCDHPVMDAKQHPNGDVYCSRCGKDLTA